MRPPLRQPLFVERRTYRQRRLMDAARLLPLFAVLLFVLPMLWDPMPGEVRSTASDKLYVFGVWGLVVTAAWLLAPRLDALPSGPDRRED
jgi:hypothetical protein